MSAYSASAPVTHSTTAPSTRNPAPPWCAKNVTAYQGLIARSTSGCCTMLCRPTRPIATNHTHITGPNTLPTRPVPRFWNQNSASSTITVSGTTQRDSAGAATLKPSIADSTVIDGVITPSPKNSEAPSNAASTTSLRVRGYCRVARWASAIIAMMPPSPRLSARMMKVTYFTATTTTSVHSTSDRTPRHAVPAAEGLAHRVKRAGADVAEHHADRADHQRAHGMALAAGFRGRGARAVVHRPLNAPVRRAGPCG